jgi:hypothetical protein
MVVEFAHRPIFIGSPLARNPLCDGPGFPLSRILDRLTGHHGLECSE